MNEEPPAIIGWDMSNGTDHSVVAVRSGFTMVCAVPVELGVVIGFREVNGRLIAETSGGVDMILPVPK